MKTVQINTQQDILTYVGEVSERNTHKLDSVTSTVKNIIEDVKKRKDRALFEYAEKFDHAKIDSLRVTEKEIGEGYDACDRELIRVLENARRNIIEYHEQQKYAPVLIDYDGRYLTQRTVPLKRAGLYVPGGKSPYPSTVLMDSVPAFVAGVKEVVMVTPPDREGKINRHILAAAKVCGIHEIYKVGGAQAIAALAYGTESIRPVQKVVGPGNLYVTAAKRMVYGDCDIDMLAGPSEVLIIADKNANPVFIAADLLSQAEHDEAAGCFLVTTDMQFAEAVEKEVAKQLQTLSKRDIASKSVETYGTIFVCRDLDTVFDVANELAPEHLEIALENPRQYVDRIENAGTIFLGEYTPEPVGDYFAGSNHTIPTSGKAKFYSPLSSYDFVKRTSVVEYSREALSKIKDQVITFAEAEALTAHANSIRKRF